jgi:hypothetical protein
MIASMTLTPRKVCAFSVSVLMLGLLCGVCDLAGSTERAFRAHRARGGRASRPDSDHVVPDLSYDWFSGRAAPSLASQEAPQPAPLVIAGLPVRAFFFNTDWIEFPLPLAHTVEVVSFTSDSGEARAPPQTLS